MYRVRTSITYATNTGGIGAEYNVIIAVNGNAIYTGWTFKQTTSNVITPVTPVDALISLNVGDTITIRTFQTSGASGGLALQSRADVNLLTIQELPNLISK
jgi:hypothetical protein